MPRKRKEQHFKHRLTEHHRRPKSLGGESFGKNISHVPENQHRAWHLLFNNDVPHMIESKLNHIWIDPRFVVIIRRREE